MAPLVGLIPAAGKGVRARPYSSLVPKGMLQVDGTPNLERLICHMRDQLQIEEIYMTVGYLSHVIKGYFGDGSKFGVRLHYVDNRELDKGLSWSILLAGRRINATCCVMLSDECYIGANHARLLDFPFEKGLVTCGVMSVDDTRLIKQNYSVCRQGNKAIRLIEKPRIIENNLLGLGTFVLTADFFPRLEKAFEESSNDYVEFITFVDSLCNEEAGVLCFEMDGIYVNINNRDSLNLARYYARNRTFADNRVSLLLYSEGVEENIDLNITQYRKNHKLDDIFVILPQQNTIKEKILAAGATVIMCPPEVDLYGEKIIHGLDNMSGDILVLAEADYSFPEHDINKLLEYLKEADMVIGTRTTRQLIEQGSDMTGLVRVANVILAKFMELLWWRREVRLTDVGCTLRALWRSSYEDMRERLTGRGPELLSEMVIETLNDRKRVIEIPVNYYNQSVALNKKYRNRKTFLSILLMIAGKKMKPFRW